MGKILALLMANSGFVLLIIPVLINLIIKKSKQSKVMIEIGELLIVTLDAMRDGKLDKSEAEKIAKEAKDVMAIFKSSEKIK